MRDRVWWLSVGFLALLFILVCIGIVRTMNANDAQFDPKPTTTEVK